MGNSLIDINLPAFSNTGPHHRVLVGIARYFDKPNCCLRRNWPQIYSVHPRLTRNAVFFAQAAFFAMLLPAAMALVYLPGSVMLVLGIAFGLSGLAVVILTARLEETGIERLFFILTGASAAAIPLAAILHNFIFGAFFFELALLVFPAIFVIGWVGSVLLMSPSGRPVSRRRKLMIGLVSALVAAVAGANVISWGKGEGFSVTSEIVNAPEEEIHRIYVTAEVDETLMPVFWHSLEHSLVSAFESNGVHAIVELVPEADRSAPTDYDLEASTFDASMHVRIDPLYRTHRDGYEAIVGTVFEVILTDTVTGVRAWRLSGEVNYIADRFFRRHGYRAHEGIRKEFAWHTTAAIVRTFMVDVEGRQSEPIYTVTEERQRHGQRTD